MSEMRSCEAIVNELRDEALKYPDTGWLSDLARRDLRWDGQNEIIVIGSWHGSVDVGHLAAIVESLIDKKTQDLTTRLEQAEQAVQLVRAMAQDWDANGNSCAAGDRSADIWHATANAIRRTLDGDTRRLADQGLGDNLARTTKNGDNNE